MDIQTYIKNLTTLPGVYRYYNADDEVIYVGKAKNLKKRVNSYFSKQHTGKTAALVQRIVRIEVTVTHTENEALILENNLIKEHRPKYNILFRDDKSYPYIFISGDPFPRLAYHRGAKRKKGQYFGPFPSAGAVHQTLNILQKVFPVRQCENSFFANRSRPCLQYQIKRCSGPCVGLISESDYAKDVQRTTDFLKGESFKVSQAIAKDMQEASEALEFEKAARLRDQIVALRKIQENQSIDLNNETQQFDVLSILEKHGVFCVQLMFFRNGQQLGSRSFFPQHSSGAGIEQVILAFVGQYYLDNQQRPPYVLSDVDSNELEDLTKLIARHTESPFEFKKPHRVQEKQWVKMCSLNAEKALDQRLNQNKLAMERQLSLQSILELPEVPNRIECFDISHSSGEHTKASCVVFENGQPKSSDYRIFNIEGITEGDDYAAMHQALTRRYLRVVKGQILAPDLIIVDGGKGQMSQAQSVLKELNLSQIPLVGIAKGETRKPGLETLIIPHLNAEKMLSNDLPGLHLMQHIRDEAHRFAIEGHRKKRAKVRTTSTLEQINGIGAKTRQKLLLHFGGLKEVQNAGVQDLMKVEGVGKNTAQIIYDHFHGE